MWNKIMAWCSYSHTIIWARIQVLVAVLLGAANAMAWGPLLDTGLTSKQFWTLAAVLFAQGLVTEIVRRYKAPDL